MYDQNIVNDFMLRSEKVIESFDIDKAFLIITTELNTCDDRYLNEYITVLNFIRHQKALDWIELNAQRVSNISLNWGHLAASSHFSWCRANTWLSMGRPYSLIALDALLYCTTIGERLNQSPWMRKIRPKLTDSPQPDIIAVNLQEYLKTDNVPRTKTAVSKIINNIFDATY